MSNSRIQELSDIIAASVVKIQQGLKEKSLPLPSFDEDAPATLPLDLVEAQDSAIDAATELRDLLMEPMLSIHSNEESDSPFPFIPANFADIFYFAA